ncbi:putative OB-fold protein [Antricoccus suffuscus]|uniref:Putative OB-fold protein n=1 Tax=Antricoccus suffuscus TaxID=1629062 RepID=A0A2T1A5R7_9ACTN|nr:zinc ribbon domain-containing protein [Antricoccus suffuscus]PRZ43953.1 putative OB-fold protein [Antricoccus suffuscus]
MTDTISVREGLFRETNDGPTLLAGRCAQCARTVFPATERCLECGDDSIESVELGAEGELLCATVVHMGNGRFDAGHSVGYVRMPHDIRVFSQITTSGEQPLPSGTPMRLEIAPLWREGEQDVLAYRFVPTTTKEADDA